MALYAILLKSYNSYSIEMTLKYFISGAIITIFLLISVLFYFIEYFNFSHLISNYVTLYNYNILDLNYNFIIFSKIQKYFYITILTALIFKLGAFPFHFYLLELYESLCVQKSMFSYTILLKVIVFFTLVRIISNFWFLNDILLNLFTYSGLGSLIISSVSSIKQLRLRKVFAYSYLNSIGLVLLSLAYSNSENFGTISVAISKYYFFSYILAWFCIWNVLVYFYKFSENSKRIFLKLNYVADLSCSLPKYTRGVTLSLLASILSLAGLPPFIGFFTKALIFFSLSSSKLGIFLLILSLFTTPLMAFTYLRLIISLLSSYSMSVSDKTFKQDVLSIVIPHDSAFFIPWSSNAYLYNTYSVQLDYNVLLLKNTEFLRKKYVISTLFNYNSCAILLLVSPIFFILF